MIEFKGWTLRVKPSKPESARLLLLLHGWTGDENSMWVFTRKLPDHYWVVAPRAPHSTKPSGYSWRIRPPEATEGVGLDELRPAVSDLLALVDAYAAEAMDAAASFDVMGFSQGAAVACALALLFPARVDKMAVLAGFVPPGSENVAPSRPLEGKRVFVAHGSMDDLVHVDDSRRSVQVLRQAGADVTVCEDEVGHKVSASCLRALQAFWLG